MRFLANLLTLPPVTFLLFLLVGWLLYKLGEWMAPPLDPRGAKLKHYACGETRRFPGQFIQPSYHLFHLAFLFTIVHVGVLMLATLTVGLSGEALAPARVAGLWYLLAMALSVVALKAR